MGTHFFTTVRDDRETEIEVEFSATGGCSAQTYGPPENCYPAEAPEVEIVRAWLLKGAPTDPLEPITLTDAEGERICTEILESPDAIPDDDGYDDY